MGNASQPFNTAITERSLSFVIVRVAMFDKYLKKEFGVLVFFAVADSIAAMRCSAVDSPMLMALIHIDGFIE